MVQEPGDSGQPHLSVGYVRTTGFYALYASLIQGGGFGSLVVNEILGPLTCGNICSVVSIACRLRYRMI